MSLERFGSTVGRFLFAFNAAALTTYVLASIAHTGMVLNNLRQLGIGISFTEHVRTAVGDLLGLYLYAAVIAIGLAIAFATMALLRVVLKSRLHLPPRLIYPLGGIVAMATLLIAMKLATSFTPIAGARSLAGFTLQCLAGGVGGYVFSRLLP